MNYLKLACFLFIVFLAIPMAPLNACAAVTPTTESTAATSKRAVNKAQAHTSSITIRNYAFVPDTLTVPLGTTVTWQNADESSHTIVDSGKEKAFHSSALDTNESYQFAFNKPGTYHYFCSVHPHMLGTIIVTTGQ